MTQPARLTRPEKSRSLRGRLRIRRLQRQGLACPNLDPQCEGRVEYATVCEVSRHGSLTRWPGSKQNRRWRMPTCPCEE